MLGSADWRRTVSGPAKVYLLWHVHHQAEEDGAIRHFANPDDFWSDEEAGDDVKHLGAYSSREAAQKRHGRSRGRRRVGRGVELACQAVKPPSTWIDAPVTYAPSALAKWATVAAISAASA